ncbi:hypothetical protein EDC04DRAFT_2687089 [Pisolithus marmoratus]|nr:hypothetical protein EDC04DRAFT_2687089 [Pisolithus marmoratus]
MLNPVEEKEIGESVYQFKGGDDEIVEQVNHEMAMKQGEVVEVESDEEAGDDADSGAEMGLGEMIHLCEQMEKVCIVHGTGETSLDLSQCLQQFRIELQHQEQVTLWQTMLGRWFGSNKE